MRKKSINMETNERRKIQIHSALHIHMRRRSTCARLLSLNCTVQCTMATHTRIDFTSNRIKCIFRYKFECFADEYVDAKWKRMKR